MTAVMRHTLLEEHSKGSEYQICFEKQPFLLSLRDALVAVISEENPYNHGTTKSPNIS